MAIGEIGLDYYWKENEPKEVQKRIFLEQVDLAKQFDLPVIIHDRDAHGDMLELFQKEVHGVQAVFHCFSGSLEMAKELAKRGYYFGFGGTSTYKNAKKVREVMQYIPKELLLFETDSPYLTPVPFRGKRNNPGYTEYTARNAAQVLGMEFEELAAIATANTKGYSKDKISIELLSAKSERSCDARASLFCAGVRSVKNKFVRIAALKLYLQC